MPEPKKNESQNNFISRCIPYMINEGKTQDQSKGICYGIWDTKKSLIDSIKKFINIKKKKKC